MKSLPARAIVKILFIYAAASGLWIFFSDRAVSLLIKDPAALTTIQTYKGWLFVLASTALLYYLLKREQVRQNRIERALNLSQQSSLVMFSGNPIPMLVYDDENLAILAVNDAALGLYEYSRDEITGLSFDKILLPEGPGEASQVRDSRSEAARYIQYHRTCTGQMLVVQVLSHPMEFNNRQACLLAVEDITGRIRTERALKTAEMSRIIAETSLRQDESRLDSLERLYQADGSSIVAATNLVLEESAQLTGSEYSFIAVMDGDLVKVQVSPQVPGEEGAFEINRQEIHPGGLLSQALKRLEPVMLQSADSLFPGILPASGGQYQAAIPILESGRAAAVAGVCGRLQPYSDADIRQLALLAGGLWRMIQQDNVLEELRRSQSRLAAAVENLPFDFWIQDQSGRFVLQNQPSQEAWGDLVGKQIDEAALDPGVASVWKAALEKAATGRLVRAEVTYPDRPEKGVYINVVAPIREGSEVRGTLGMNISIAALKERERELAALVSIAGAMRAASSRSEMRATLLGQVMDLLKIDAAALVSQEYHEKDVLVDLGVGVWTPRTGQRMQFVDHEAVEIFRREETHWSGNVQEDQVMSRCPLFQEMYSGACIPLKPHGTARYALWVGSMYSLTSSQIHLLETIADIAGNAIHRAELNEQTERHLQRLTALRAIDLAITSSLDVRLTLNILISQIISQLNIDAADVLLFSPTSLHLEHAASRGFSTGFLKSVRLRLGKSHAGRAAHERVQVFIPDLQTQDPAFFQELKRNGENFTSYLGQPLIAKGQVKGVLEVFQRSRLNPTPDWLDFLEAVSTQAAIAIDNADMFDTLQKANTDLTTAYDATIEGWSRALELRDRETQGHTQRVTRVTLRLAELVGIEGEDLVNVRRGVLLHDIGKMAIPDRILLKPGPLTSPEWDIMRQHPRYAYEMLSPIPYLRASIDIPYSHHERWDGSGYPRGLKGSEIPLPARIFAVVDVWDALISNRPYRQAWTKEKVIRYLRSQAGKRLDPEIVVFFIDNLDDLQSEASPASPLPETPASSGLA